MFSASFLAGIIIEVSAFAPANARSPRLVTLDGMVIEVSEVAPSKAKFPMLTIASFNFQFKTK
jgi:hypothetical protein